MTELPLSGRRCPVCGAIEGIGPGEPVWPLHQACGNCGYVVPQADGIAMFAPELADTTVGFDPRAFEELATLEDQHFWFVARNELICGLIRKFFPQAMTFMEVGCGTGFVLRQVARSRDWARLVGSELHPAGLVHARRRLPPGTELVQMDARRIPAQATFDLIGAFDVIEHIADDEAVLKSMRSAVVAGGGIVITVPQHPILWSRADEVAHHVRRYRRGELEVKLRRAGFDILYSSSFTSLLLPLLAASRLSEKRRGEDAYEFKLNPGLNRLLLSLSRLEVWLTLRGLRWPMGGSRVVVGRAA